MNSNAAQNDELANNRVKISKTKKPRGPSQEIRKPNHQVVPGNKAEKEDDQGQIQ